MLIIVFGEMGMGKNFVSECLAQEMGIQFIDGDSAIPDKTSLQHKADVDHFVKSQLIPMIQSELKLHKNLIVSQALYFEEHRKLIENQFKYLTTVKFINVRATKALQEERLLTREKGREFWLPYSERSHRHFSHEGDIFMIENNKGKAEVIDQIKSLPFYNLKEMKLEGMVSKVQYAK